MQASGISAERLASYDRPIKNEPCFSRQQVPGLLSDLRMYLHTLHSVHSGEDLASAAGSVLGYSIKSIKGMICGRIKRLDLLFLSRPGFGFWFPTLRQSNPR